jgi:hypothetical protein
VLILLALASAALGTYYSAHAAYGLPEEEQIASAAAAQRWRHTEAKRAAGQLRKGLIAAFLTLPLLAAAIGFTWYVTPDPPAFLSLHTATGETICATLIRDQAPKALIVKANGEIRRIRFAQISLMAVVKSC